MFDCHFLKIFANKIINNYLNQNCLPPHFTPRRHQITTTLKFEFRVGKLLHDPVTGATTGTRTEFDDE